MDAGSLIHAVDLERDTITRESGAEVRTPATYAAKVPARVEFLSGNEYYRAQSLVSQCNVRVVLRYRTDVLPSDRVIYKGKRYEIRAAMPDEATLQTITLECRG